MFIRRVTLFLTLAVAAMSCALKPNQRLMPLGAWKDLGSRALTVRFTSYQEMWQSRLDLRFTIVRFEGAVQMQVEDLEHFQGDLGGRALTKQEEVNLERFLSQLDGYVGHGCEDCSEVLIMISIREPFVLKGAEPVYGRLLHNPFIFEESPFNFLAFAAERGARGYRNGLECALEAK